MDYDFDWFIFEHEYCKNPDKQFPLNENDTRYLEYCNLLIQALEVGVGYRVEWEDTLYLAPTPLVKIDPQNRFHSDRFPAIRWKGADEFFFLHGISFEEKLWTKVVNRKITMEEVLKIKDIDQRTQAMKYVSVDAFLKHVEAMKLDEYHKLSIDGNDIAYELYKIPQNANSPFTKEVRYVRYWCPSTSNEYLKGVPELDTVADAMGWASQLSPGNWKRLVPLSTES